MTEKLERILKILLQSEIAENEDLDCKATVLKAQAIIELADLQPFKLNNEELEILEMQKLYIGNLL